VAVSRHARKHLKIDGKGLVIHATNPLPLQRVVFTLEESKSLLKVEFLFVMDALNLYARQNEAFSQRKKYLAFSLYNMLSWSVSLLRFFL
jgi:hypothetical protein